MAHGFISGQHRQKSPLARRLCTLRKFDPRLWDASVEGENAFQRNRRRNIAVKVCGQCHFRQECMKKAQGDGYLEGVWGGVSFTQGIERTL